MSRARLQPPTVPKRSTGATSSHPANRAVSATATRLEFPTTTALAALFAVTVFLSAFLLFQVQPIISKAILPWYGGTPGVWTTCMLFFQGVLFAGYSYAHWLSSRLRPRTQFIVHTCLLATALVTLHLLPGPEWKPAGQQSAEAGILWLLLASVGLPYFAISSTGPLLQRWFSTVLPERSPYRLYALSNAGSLLALLSYPFVVEPALAMPAQGALWTVGFAAFALLCAACAAVHWRCPQSADVARLAVFVPDSGLPHQSPVPIQLVTRLKWFSLPLLASVLLLAVTSQVCQDVAVIPFLWVAPLSLYLLSFILTFDSDRWYQRQVFSVGTLLGVLGVCGLLLQAARTPMLVQVGVYFTLLFCGCMLCHGELARLRPPPAQLTSFYLTMSAGGAAGGLASGLLAPHLFPAFWELHLGLLASAALALRFWFDATGRRNQPENNRPPVVAPGHTFFAAMLLLAIGVILTRCALDVFQSVAATRNFYGTLSVERNPENNSLVLRHGRIIHGLQFQEPSRNQLPTTYYGPQSGLGRLLSTLRDGNRPLRMGGVGLGIGTLAAWGQPGDTLRFYEINADVIELAQRHFHYLDRTPANVELVLGDARLSLETESPQQFDLLVLDAFSGDAVPAHLLTREAMVEYSRHVADGGVLAIHISNLHFDLRPVVDALAEEARLECLTIHQGFSGTDETGQCSSKWSILTSQSDLLLSENLQSAALPPQPGRVLWTDQFSNLLGVLR